jgi:trans-aconitate methyltransferase
MKFIHPGDSHRHSLQVLNACMNTTISWKALPRMADLGCGTGEDLEWWATRTTRDDNPQPLNIQCQGIDLQPKIACGKKIMPTLRYQRTDFEGKHAPQKGFDILWCHDAFQYCLNPVQTLSNWWHIASEGGMLAISVPQTQR